MNILSAGEMQECDRVTSERFGVASIELMRNAARAVAEFAVERFPQARRVTVLCGKGNNGGDGAMAARLLAERGLDVRVLLLGAPGELAGDAAVAWKELVESDKCTVQLVRAAEALEWNADALRTDLIVDAVMGTGFRPPLRGIAAKAAEWVRKSGAPVLAVDLPSGWPADSTLASVEARVFPADAVITFTAPKPAHVFGQLTRLWDQPVVVAGIGSPEEAVVSTQGLVWGGSAAELIERPRVADSNKGNFGHVLVAGGTFGAAGGKSGAPAMAALAALRAGAGLVTAAVPEPALAVVAGFAPELMTVPLKANGEGQIAAGSDIAALVKGITVAAVGPGMGQSADTVKFLNEFLTGTTMPLVLDADALNNLARQAESVLQKAAKERVVVLTPHPGEMARLAGMTVADVQANRLETARHFAVKNGVTVVLKGARTLIAHPDGRVAVNTTGNPGMAKGGSGDVLAGMIAGMLAQFPNDAALAVEVAVYLHGLAADFAARAGDEHALLATDSFRFFSQAFRFHSRAYRGYVWLQGAPE